MSAKMDARVEPGHDEKNNSSDALAAIVKSAFT